MSVTIESDLKEILAKFDKLENKLDNLQKDVNDLKLGEIRFETEIQGLAKRLDNQEFLNRTIFVGIILALLVGLVKMFYPTFPSL